LPGFDAADLHELVVALSLPRHFCVGHLSVESVDGAGVSGSNQHDVVLLNIEVVPDALGLTLDGVVNMQLGRIDHHF